MNQRGKTQTDYGNEVPILLAMPVPMVRSFLADFWLTSLSFIPSSRIWANIVLVHSDNGYQFWVTGSN